MFEYHHRWTVMCKINGTSVQQILQEFVVFTVAMVILADIKVQSVL